MRKTLITTARQNWGKDNLGSRALKNGWLWAMAGASFVVIFALNVPFPLIVLVDAIILAMFFGSHVLWPQSFSGGI